MRALLTVALVALVLLAAGSASARPHVVAGGQQSYEALFGEFKRRFKRQYASAGEEARRLAIFVENMKRAAALEQQNPLARFGVNEYSDVSAAEFKQTHHNADFSRLLATRKPINVTAVGAGAGSKIDWRAKGAVTGVKNQKSCGGCWSFSTTGNIEGQWFLAGHSLVSLSEQELLSCDTNLGGCHGGDMDAAFEWLVSNKNGWIKTEASYPFVSGDGQVPTCNLNNRVDGAQISGHHDLPQSETKIGDYMYTNGPVSIGVDGSSFQTYQGGILTNCQYVKLDHAVLIVGYDETHNPPYWIIKNSWGVSWGEEGYIRVQKGTNQCGLELAASSSLVTKNGPPAPSATPVPASPPSPPTPPVTPVPAPSGGANFTFSLCTESSCSDCQRYSFPQGACIDEEFNGDSFTAQCYDIGFRVDVTTYVGSQQCSGSGTSQKVWGGTCYENVDRKTYIKFDCPL